MITSEQFALRQKGIGGSDAAKVAGVSPWGTPLDVYESKLGMESPKETTEAMRIGNALEPMVLDYYSKKTGFDVKRDNDTLFSKKNPFMLANIDGLVTSENIIVEAKTARSKTGWGNDGSSNIPIDYLLQVAHYCAVYNVPRADVVVFFKLNEEYSIYHYDRNEELEKALIKKESDFWNNHVLPQIPPAPSKRAELESHYQFDDGAKIIAPSLIQQKWESLKKIKEKQKALAVKAEEIQLDIMLHMGAASELVDTEGAKLASWKTITSHRFDSTKFKKTNPDVYQTFMKESISRRFLTY